MYERLVSDSVFVASHSVGDQTQGIRVCAVILPLK